MLVLDGSVDSSVESFECSTDLLQIGSSGPTYLSDAGKDYLDFQQDQQRTLTFSGSPMLHVDSHGGFAVLVSLQIEASAGDQTVFSFLADSGAHLQLAVDVDSSSYTFTISDDSGSSFAVHTLSDALPVGVQHMLVAQFERHNNNMDIISIESDLSMASIATQASRDSASSEVCIQSLRASMRHVVFIKLWCAR